ncbi:MAG: hypothetical protein SRB2_00101 [Desulfobacteraceae bacterium Eth-SRB2]|nr:MAG: hypothetical protein SRB2_00101 [Desulfobacteraceae bacterium Eth-SRB2]
MDKTIKQFGIGTIITVLLFFMGSGMAWGDSAEVKIGVLAKRGQERCLGKWSPTAKYLSAGIPGKTFVIVPLDSRQIYSAVEKGEIDFVLANPSIYVEIEHRFEASRIATLKNLRLGKAYTAYGGVVFCRADCSDIRRLTDLKGKTFMIVDDLSLAGWRAVWRELKEKGIDPYRDFTKLMFGHIHDEVVYAVRDGLVEAGSVRTDSLERMAMEKKIDLQSFHVIHDHGDKPHKFPFLHSTRLYPEWPMARIKHTSDELAEKVAIELIEMPADSQAAEAARCAGWTTPLNYQPVQECLKELKLGPYKDLGKIKLIDVIRNYWHLILVTFALFLVMAGSLFVFCNLNRKIQASQVKLQLEVEERKRTEKLLMGSEEKFSKAFHHGPLLMTINSIEDGKFIDVNENFVRTTGYSRAEAIGATSVDLGFISKEDRDKLVQETIKNECIDGKELILRKKNNGKLYCRYFGEIIMIAGEQRLLSIVSDISERKKVEKALRQHEKQLFQTQKMESLGALVSGVAHEINNPISLILFNISVFQNIWQDFQPVMEQQAKKEPTRKYGGLKYSYIEKKLDHLLSDTGTASGRIANIVSSLKNFARQTDIAEKRPMQINEAVNYAVKLSQTTLRKSQATVDIELAHNLPLIEGNIQSIEQIVLNLIINAIQSIEHNKGKISIITEFQKEKNKIIISISDNGKGIEPSLSERIFDPFITDKQAQGGTGLGLSVTYNLVKAHDGEISFKSRQGKGTIFTLCLPTKQVELTAKILVADDNKIIRHMLKEVLAEHPSYLVEDVGNGIETCIKLGSFHPDLLILDLNMPGMDGLEVCRTISKDPNLSNIKIMIITGYPDDSRVKQIAKLGYTHIYTKPLNLKDFLKKVNIILRESKNEPEYGIHSRS